MCGLPSTLQNEDSGSALIESPGGSLAPGIFGEFLANNRVLLTNVLPGQSDFVASWDELGKLVFYH